jgi:hypothetical protein
MQNGGKFKEFFMIPVNSNVNELKFWILVAN